VEVHRIGTFAPQDLEEVRLAPEDSVREARVARLLDQRLLPTPEELLWGARRRLIDEKLRQRGIRLRIVDSHARGGRWR
jgi:hypothetical protein